MRFFSLCLHHPTSRLGVAVIIGLSLFYSPVYSAAPVPTPQEKPTHQQPVTTADKPPARIYQSACLPLLQNQVTGNILPPIHDQQCQVKSPLQISAFNRPVTMKFDQPVTTNCSMTVTLTQWAKEANQLAQIHFGSDIEIIGTGSHYQCRKVNNGLEGRISEHAFANALDIMSFTFANGKTTTLGTDWNGSAEQKVFWRTLHSKSCTLFMTVLGPEADDAHKTNLHLDMGCHGKSCTERICQ